MMRKAIRNMIGRIRFQRAATVLPALLLVMAGMSSCSENEDVNDVPVPSAEGTGVEFSLGMAGWNESRTEARACRSGAGERTVRHGDKDSRAGSRNIGKRMHDAGIRHRQGERTKKSGCHEDTHSRYIHHHSLSGNG